MDYLPFKSSLLPSHPLSLSSLPFSLYKSAQDVEMERSNRKELEGKENREEKFEIQEKVNVSEICTLLLTLKVKNKKGQLFIV